MTAVSKSYRPLACRAMPCSETVKAKGMPIGVAAKGVSRMSSTGGDFRSPLLASGLASRRASGTRCPSCGKNVPTAALSCEKK